MRQLVGCLILNSPTTVRPHNESPYALASPSCYHCFFVVFLADGKNLHLIRSSHQQSSELLKVDFIKVGTNHYIRAHLHNNIVKQKQQHSNILSGDAQMAHKNVLGGGCGINVQFENVFAVCAG